MPRLFVKPYSGVFFYNQTLLFYHPAFDKSMDNTLIIPKGKFRCISNKSGPKSTNEDEQVEHF